MASAAGRHVSWALSFRGKIRTGCWTPLEVYGFSTQLFGMLGAPACSNGSTGQWKNQT